MVFACQAELRKCKTLSCWFVGYVYKHSVGFLNIWKEMRFFNKLRSNTKIPESTANYRRRRKNRYPLCRRNKRICSKHMCYAKCKHNP